MAQSIYKKNKVMAEDKDKERRVKLIQGEHQLSYHTVSPTEDKRIQMEQAA